MKPTFPSVDEAKKPRKWLWIAAPAVVLLVLARVLSSNPLTNQIQTSPDASDAALRTRFYSAPLEDVEVATREIVPTLGSYGRPWRFMSAGFVDEAAGSRFAAIEVPVLMFVDDLKVTLQAQDGKTRVDVESKSRVGHSDFGENRRHVLQVLSALDKRFNASN